MNNNESECYSKQITELQLTRNKWRKCAQDLALQVDGLIEERDMLANENHNFAWHLECIGYADQTIDKIAMGFHKEDDDDE